MSDEKEPKFVNGITPAIARVVADLSHEDGRLAGALESLAMQVQDAVAHMRGLECNEHRRVLAEHGESLIEIKKRLSADLGVHIRRPPSDEYNRKTASGLYEKVGGKLEARAEEVTERLELIADQAAHKAVARELEERAAADEARRKVEREERDERARQALLDIELRHKRSMSKIKIAGAILGLLVTSGIVATVKGLLGSEAAQVETTRTLKRIEAKQAKMSPPDMGAPP